MFSVREATRPPGGGRVGWVWGGVVGEQRNLSEVRVMVVEVGPS